MPEIELSPGVNMFYQDDDFTDPWKTAEPIFLLHGFCESGVAWNGWVPQLARHFRVIRPDMRGFGRSTPMPADHQWTAEELINDFLRLAEQAGYRSLPSRRREGRRRHRAPTCGYPSRARALADGYRRHLRERGASGRPHRTATDRGAEFAAKGVGDWARESMSGRGTSARPRCSKVGFS